MIATWLYGAICAVTGLFVWSIWSAAMRPRSRAQLDRSPDMYDLALLNGGAQLAITTAAAKLHRDGAVRYDDDGRLEAAGAVSPRAHRLERAIFEAARRRPAPTIAELRRELEDGDAIAALRAELQGAGLLLDERRAARLRRLWPVGVALLGLGVVAGSSADAQIGGLLAIGAVVVACTYWLARTTPISTARGRALVADRRKVETALRRQPPAAQGAMAAALFGGGALWSADPDVAQTLGVPREAARNRRGLLHGGYGYGACSVGTMCAGGGIFEGGSAGSFDGGGGGCGGGGGGGCGGGS